MIIDDDLRPLEGESLDDFAYRVGEVKMGSDDITWADVADLVNTFYNVHNSPDKYRKSFSRRMKSNSAPHNTTSKILFGDDPLEDMYKSIKMERMKLAEQNAQMNATLRTLSREETIKEIASEYARYMNTEKLLKPYEPITEVNEKVAILNISDWHYGAEVDNIWNKFNPEICKERVSKLKDQVIQYGLDNNITELVVVNLSDLISGNIHLPLRIQSRINVIQQTMDVAEILTEFIHSLSEHFYVTYFDCIDNHSRINPNKKESIQLESLTEIIHWHLKHRFEGHENVNIGENAISRDIIAFTLRGWNVAAVHGDLDKQSDVVQRLSLMTKQSYNLILTGHLHHFSCDERNECVVVSNPSLMGTDDYAQQLRTTSRPAQNLIIMTKDNPVEDIKRILL